MNVVVPSGTLSPVCAEKEEWQRRRSQVMLGVAFEERHVEAGEPHGVKEGRAGSGLHAAHLGLEVPVSPADGVLS